jgi:hypothetical protein
MTIRLKKRRIGVARERRLRWLTSPVALLGKQVTNRLPQKPSQLLRIAISDQGRDVGNATVPYVLNIGVSQHRAYHRSVGF